MADLEGARRWQSIGSQTPHRATMGGPAVRILHLQALVLPAKIATPLGKKP
jgi:hypothetical protein